MTDDSQKETRLGDFKDILSTSIGGELPLLVGGHAVNLWATVYQRRLGEALEPWLPLTSKDLDLFGTAALLEELKARFGGEFRLSGPRSPVVGQWVVKLGAEERVIDVLRDVVGIGAKELSGDTVVIGIREEGEIYRIRVLPVPVILQAKVANLATLDQKGRNDFKHVNLLLLVAREYLSELIESTENGALDSRACIRALEQVLTIIRSPAAEKCSRLHGIRFDPVWPRKSLEAAADSRLRNFVKHRLPEEAP